MRTSNKNSPNFDMETIYKAALIGCGNIGAGVERYSAKIQPWAHASVLTENPRTELAALVDGDPAKREKAHGNFPNAPLFADAREMFETVQPDIVVIATPTSSHKALTLMAVEYRVKAIVCEKPIAETIEDGEEMIRACHAAGIPLFINHIRRFDPVIRAAKARLSEIGEVTQADARYTRGIHNNGTHTIDLLRFFLGDIVAVSGTRNEKTETFTDLPGDQNIDGILFFASGARAAIQSFDYKDYSIFDFDWYGRTGLISLRHFGFRVEVTGVKDCSAFVGHKELDELYVERSGETRSFMAPMMQHVVDCLDGKDTPVGAGEDGLAALRVIAALEESAKQQGKRVDIS
jgi:predicted dehydrogenase